MKKILSKLKDEKGQNLVEFALIVGILLAIVFGITEFGRAWYRADRLKNAANTAARTYAVTKEQAVAVALRNATGIVGHSTGFSFYTSDTGTIKVTVKEYYVSVVPLVPSIAGNIAIFGNHTISRDATYRLER